MLKAAHVLAFAPAALALMAGSAAHAQSDQRRPYSDSRIHPDSIMYPLDSSDGKTVVPPPPIVSMPMPMPSSTSVRREREPEALPDPQSTASMVAAVGTCLKVLQPGYELNLKLLVDNSWGFTQPVQTRSAIGEYEKVDYIKDNLTISLRDFGDRVICRVGGMIEDQEQFADIREQLTQTLGATPMAETRGYELAAQLMAERQPNSSIGNVYIIGEHLIEIATTEQDLSRTGISGAGVETFAFLTSTPTAANMRKLNEAILNQ
ncbi:MAG: hypothetical protein AAFR64_04530 [Pseudomonadota bacterium]